MAIHIISFQLINNKILFIALEIYKSMFKMLADLLSCKGLAFKSKDVTCILTA